MSRSVAALALGVQLLVVPPALARIAPLGDPISLDVPLECANGDPAVAALDDGGFVAVWTDGAILSARRVDAAGKPTATEIVLASGLPLAPEAVALPGGGYAVAWFDPLRSRVLARFVDAAGSAGPEVEVGVAGPDPGSGFGGLDATAGPDGTLAVTWANASAAGAACNP